ncbi:golgin subfamily A member 1 [Nilaparvata lugens]|uniref:golgin subfamily A member 1 n=1 Tax=Nilaparvata lugens TaxID=108931 RepID=UPI000B987A96|nr:golgin subfamily A member 1 [Nilaparvata lugens]
MFNNMKNKIREKTGSELPKFSLGQIQQKVGLGRHSRQGSETSLSSFAPDDEHPPPPLPPPPTLHEDPPLALKPDNNELVLADGKSLTPKDLTRLAKREDEWRSRLERRDAEWTTKLERREAELTRLLEEKEREWRKQEQSLTEDLLRSTRELKDALKMAEECKRKMNQHQEDKDQLEGFQNQELAKIKHLLLQKEQENAENGSALKEATALVESLKQEVNRLRPFEEQVSNFQDDMECLRHSSDKERWLLSSRLAQAEETVRHLRDRVAVLTCRSEAECVALGATLSSDERVQALLGERALLERRLEEAHVHLSDIKASWSGQISALETQVGRLSRQAGEEGVERRRAEQKIMELEARLEEEQKEKQKLVGKLERTASERDNLAQELKNVAQHVAITKSENIDLGEKVIDAEKKYQECLAENERLSQELMDERRNSKESMSGSANNDLLVEQLAQITKELETLKEKNGELEKAAQTIREERDKISLKTTQMSEELKTANQQLEVKQQEYNNLHLKMSEQLSKEAQEREAHAAVSKENENSFSHLEKELQATISDLQDQLGDKNKMIRVLQQRIADMKKTLQRELKSSDPGGGGVTNNVNSNLSSGEQNHISNSNQNSGSVPFDNDVNFKYLKHVLIKFLTCREYEAQHLTRAVATLLKFSPEEERLLRDTLEWKMSWFGSRPRLPTGKSLSHS